MLVCGEASDSNPNKTLSLLFGVITIIFIFIVFIFIGNKCEALKSFICLALIKVKSARRKVLNWTNISSFTRLKECNGWCCSKIQGEN